MPTPQKRILIVDDEVSLTRLLKLNLEQANYAVRVENWPGAAIGAAREFKPNLIFLDVMMPSLDGGNVAAALQADPTLKHIPIVFLTGAVKPDEVGKRDGLIGGFPFLAKPAGVPEVIRCIERYLPK